LSRKLAKEKGETRKSWEDRGARDCFRNRLCRLLKRRGEETGIWGRERNFEQVKKKKG